MQGRFALLLASADRRHVPRATAMEPAFQQRNCSVEIMPANAEPAILVVRAAVKEGLFPVFIVRQAVTAD